MSLYTHFQHILTLREKSTPKNKVGMVTGNFNVVHPGHLRLLKFAADCCDILIVAVNTDDTSGVLMPANLRLEGVQAIGFVDYAFILETSLEDAINAIQPDLMVKGKEHERIFNPEKEFLDKFGGELIFSSGDAVFSSIDLLRADSDPTTSRHNLKTSFNYLQRHGISVNRLTEILNKFSKLNVLVIGDLIIDEYISCDVLGLSREDPTVVVTPVLEQKFVGGAGIVASHAQHLGAKTTFLTVCGDDDEAVDSLVRLKEYRVEAEIKTDKSRPTTLKQRFRSAGKTLLRVSKLKQHAIDQRLQDLVFNSFVERAENLDLVIFSDFNYGVLPQPLVDRISEYCNINEIRVAADSQSSSQIGNIARFNNMMLLKPTEIEARLAIQDHESGLVGVAEKLAKKCNPFHILLTLGAEGTLIHTQHVDSSHWMTDRLPALCTNPKDPAGAGDAMLVTSSMALATGASIWEAAYIGSVASGCQVATVGNTPLKIDDIKHEIQLLENSTPFPSAQA